MHTWYTLALIFTWLILQLPARPHLGKGPRIKNKWKVVKRTGNISANKRLQGDRLLILKNPKSCYEKDRSDLLRSYQKAKLGSMWKKYRGWDLSFSEGRHFWCMDSLRMGLCPHFPLLFKQSVRIMIRDALKSEASEGTLQPLGSGQAAERNLPIVTRGMRSVSQSPNCWGLTSQMIQLPLGSKSLCQGGSMQVIAYIPNATIKETHWQAALGKNPFLEFFLFYYPLSHRNSLCMQ